MLVHCKTHNAPRPRWYDVTDKGGEGFKVLAFTKAEARERFLALKGWTRFPARRGFKVSRVTSPSRPVSIPVVQKKRRATAKRTISPVVPSVTPAVTTQAPVARNVLSFLAECAWIEPHPVRL